MTDVWVPDVEHPRTILVGVDPADDDGAPLALAHGIARLTGAPVVLACAHAASEPPSQVRALHALADEEDAGVLVVGATRHGAADRALHGSTTARLLHGAPCAVAVAPHGLRDEDVHFSRVGVAFIDTPEGRDALTAAIAIAALSGGRVRLLTVFEPLEPAPDALALHQERDRREAARSALQVAADLVPEELRDGGELLVGRAAESLAAASADLDLLVCGSRGYGPVCAALLGSVSGLLVDTTRCPLLVMPRVR